MTSESTKIPLGHGEEGSHNVKAHRFAVFLGVVGCTAGDPNPKSSVIEQRATIGDAGVAALDAQQQPRVPDEYRLSDVPQAGPSQSARYGRDDYLRMLTNTWSRKLYSPTIFRVTVLDTASAVHTLKYSERWSRTVLSTRNSVRIDEVLCGDASLAGSVIDIWHQGGVADDGTSQVPENGAEVSTGESAILVAMHPYDEWLLNSERFVLHANGDVSFEAWTGDSFTSADLKGVCQ